jgi:beta-lactamase regulating signal transducer with metallopeptidase domain
VNAQVLNSWAESWSGFAVTSLMDGMTALAVVALCWWVVRRWASPQVGCWLFLLVMLKVALPGRMPVEIVNPWLSQWIPGVDVASEQALSRRIEAVTAALARSRGAQSAQTEASAAVARAATSETTAPAQLSLTTILMAGWAGIAALGMMRLAWVAARTRRIMRASVPVEGAEFNFDALKELVGVSPKVSLRISGHLASPAVCGLWHPCVLLPSGLEDTLSPAQMRWVLLHELFHIRRGDLWFALAQSALRTLFFFHPAMWLADRAASALRERACDDAALAVGGMDARESADGFLRLIEWIGGRPPTPVPVLGLFTLNHKHQILQRLMKLNDPTLHRAHRLGWTGRLAVIALATTLVPSLRPVELSAEDAAALRERIGALEKRVDEGEQARASEHTRERQFEENRAAARKRASEDNAHYKPEELKEIEDLYQVANKNWRTDEARESLKKLLAKYDKANRTGCATLYMGQMSTGKDRLDYLNRAVEKFSDCYYFDGCQVGGYGRYVLALTLWESGDKSKARTLFKELKTKYKDTTDHKGRLMTDAVEAVEKELEKKG